MIFLDANVLVYSVDPADAVRRTIATDVIRRASGRAMIVEQALFEFAHVAIRKLGMARDQAAATVRSLAQNFKIVLPPHDIVDRTLDVMLAHKIAIWDARLLAVCSTVGTVTLLSEDLQDGRNYGTVTVVNPFEAVNATILSRILPP